jgi:hypothetical protein
MDFIRSELSTFAPPGPSEGTRIIIIKIMTIMPRTGLVGRSNYLLVGEVSHLLLQASFVRKLAFSGQTMRGLHFLRFPSK